MTLWLRVGACLVTLVSIAHTTNAFAQTPTEAWEPPGLVLPDDEPTEGQVPPLRLGGRRETTAPDDEPAGAPPTSTSTFPTTFLLRARLPLAYGQTSVLYAGPRLVLGLRLERVELALGLSLAFGSGFDEEVAGGETVTREVDYFAWMVAPGIAYVVAQSRDAMSRLHIGANVFIGSDDNEYADGTSTSAMIYGLCLVFGGEHRFAPAFGMGVEGGWGALLGSGAEGTATAELTGLFAAIFATIYTS